MTILSLQSPSKALRDLFCFVSVLSILFYSETQALSVRMMPLPKLVKTAQLIAHGRVISQEMTSRPSPTGKPWIFTLSTVEISECWYSKGACPKQVLVSQIGGTLPSSDPAIPALTLNIPGLPTLNEGEEATLFLTPKTDVPTPSPQFVVVGGAQGVHRGPLNSKLKTQVLQFIAQPLPLDPMITIQP